MRVSSTCMAEGLNDQKYYTPFSRIWRGLQGWSLNFGYGTEGLLRFIRLCQDTLQLAAERNAEAAALQLVREKAGEASVRSRSKYPAPLTRDCEELHSTKAEKYSNE
jgi:hypothetical protein